MNPLRLLCRLGYHRMRPFPTSFNDHPVEGQRCARRGCYHFSMRMIFDGNEPTQLPEDERSSSLLATNLPLHP